MPERLEELEADRARLYQELSRVGDFRRGSIATNYRCCGKPNCACCRPEHPGHGPQFLLMTKVHGRSVANNIRPGPELKKIEREVAHHQRFREGIQKIVEVNEQICQMRPVEQENTRSDRITLKKKLSKSSKRRSDPK